MEGDYRYDCAGTALVELPEEAQVTLVEQTQIADATEV